MSSALVSKQRKTFLGQPAPAGYVPGLGRGYVTNILNRAHHISRLLTCLCGCPGPLDSLLVQILVQHVKLMIYRKCPHTVSSLDTYHHVCMYIYTFLLPYPQSNYYCYTYSDERHPRPGTKRPREDDEDEEEDLNESNYDEVCLTFPLILCPVCGHYWLTMCRVRTLLAHDGCAQFAGYGGNLFASAPYEADDREADEVYESIDTHMDSRRKIRREKKFQEQVEKYRQERPKIQQQFSDLRVGPLIKSNQIVYTTGCVWYVYVSSVHWVMCQMRSGLTFPMLAMLGTRNREMLISVQIATRPFPIPFYREHPCRVAHTITWMLSNRSLSPSLSLSLSNLLDHCLSYMCIFHQGSGGLHYPLFRSNVSYPWNYDPWICHLHQN